MNRRFVWFGAGTVILVSVSALFYFWNRSDIRSDVLKAISRPASRDKLADSDDGDDDGDGPLSTTTGGLPPNLLGPDDAAFLRSAKSALRELSLPANRKSQYVDDELTERLFEEADRRKLPTEGTSANSEWTQLRSRFGDSPLSALAPGVKEDLAALIERQIREISDRVAYSLSEQAVLEHLDAEAELRVIYRDLEKVKSDRTSLPADAVGLIPPEQLELAIKSLRPHQRALEERLALAPTPEVKMARDHLQRRIDSYETARKDHKYAEFHKDGNGFSALSSDVQKDNWDAIQADFDTRVKAESVRMRAQEAALPNYGPTVWLAQQQRGPPPDSPAARIVDAIRCYDLEVMTALRSQARIEATLSALRMELPASHPLLKLDGYQRLLATLDPADFNEITRINRESLVAQAAQTPDSIERDFFVNGWAEAIDAETKRRGSSSNSLQDIAIGSDVSEILDRQLKGRDKPLSAESEAKFLATAQLRFPSHGEMPLSVRSEVGRLVGQSIEKYRGQLNSARERYENIAERIALVTGAIDPKMVEKVRGHRTQLQQAVREYSDYVTVAAERQINIDEKVHADLAIMNAWFFGPDDLQPPRSPAEPQPPPQGPAPTGPTGGANSPTLVNELEALRGREGPTDGQTKSNRRGARRYLLASDPGLSGALDRVGELSDTIHEFLDAASTKPVKFGAEKGRYSVSSEALKADLNFSSALALDEKKNRLPDFETDWEGRLKDGGEAEAGQVPYDFEKEVWRFKNFTPVGGGVHFGSMSTYKGRNLSHFVLRYDRTNEQLLLIGPGLSKNAAPTIFRLVNIKPEVLKPLYQFVASDRNAAISIGWGMERANGVFDSTVEQAVLLDPFLVDTPIGQDLVLADSIPWEFHTKKIGGEAFSAAFGEALKQTYSSTEGLLDPLVSNLAPYDRRSVNQWARATSDAFLRNEFGILARSIIQSTSVEEARKAYFARIAGLAVQGGLDQGLTEEKLTPTAGSDLSELNAAATRLVDNGAQFEAIFRHIFESNDDYAARAVSELIARGSEALEKDARDRIAAGVETEEDPVERLLLMELARLFRDLPEDKSEEDGNVDESKAISDKGSQPSAYDALILSELSEQVEFAVISPRGCDAGLLKNWFAACLAAGEPENKEQLRKELISRLIWGHTALSVLMDNPAKSLIELTDDEIATRVKMEYQYARTRVTIKGGRVYFGKVPDDADDREVDRLDALTKLVNAHYADIASGFAPLQRVQKYAELAALLRWARRAKKDGKLAAIDFSELADIAARDRDQFPTPDVLVP